MYSVIISAEITCFVFMLITLGGTLVSSEKKDTSTKFFIAGLVSLMVSLLVDALSYLLDGRPHNGTLFYFIVTSTYILPNICLAIFTYYMTAVIREVNRISYIRAKIISVICFLDAIWIAVGAYTGKLFVVENNSYSSGPWHTYVSLVPTLCLAYLFMMAFFYRKSMGLKMAAAISTYVIFPLCGSLMQLLINPVGGYALVTGAFAYGLIFVVLQVKTFADINVRENVLKEIHSKDYLTLLLNRRGYDLALEDLISSSNIGVFFCDINFLKYTNDNLGHEAGDKLLKKFADILREVFDKGALCRISGDEFVVLLRNVEGSEMEGYSDRLREAIRKNGGIAAFGCAYGKNRMALELVDAAEQKMYQDKEKYYKTA